MATPPMAMPIAHPPDGTDPEDHYAAFGDAVQAAWSSGDGLSIYLGDDDSVPVLHAPLHALVFFLPAGTAPAEGADPVSEPTLLLKTWPSDFFLLADTLDGPVPSVTTLSNVDPDSLQEAAEDLLAAMPIDIDPGEVADRVDAFKAGEAALKATAGAVLGKAGPAADGDDDGAGGGDGANLPRRVSLRMQAPDGSELHPVYYLGKMATAAGIDLGAHPLLKLLDFTAAEDPDLASQLVRIEEPGDPGTFRPADRGLFKTLSPKVRLSVPSDEGMRVWIADRTGEERDVTDEFTFDADGGAAEGVLDEADHRSGTRALRVGGPAEATVRFILYSDDELNVPVPYPDESEVPTHVPQITRSDLLIGVIFAEGVSDAAMGEVLRRRRVLPVSLIRPSDYVTVRRPSHVDIFDTLEALQDEALVDHAFVPGTIHINSEHRGAIEHPVWIEDRDFTLDLDVPLPVA